MTFHTLDTIRLSRFIDMWLGDVLAVLQEPRPLNAVELAEAEKAARDLCEKYVDIIGGRQVAARLSQENDRLKLRMRRVCLETAKALLNSGDTENAVKVLASAGLNVTGDAAEIRRRIDGWLAQDGYKAEKLRQSAEAEQAAEAGASGRDWWTRERVAVMRWAQMYVDERQMSAAEYAWMVRAMCEDMRRAMNEQRRIKNKRKNV